MTNHILCKDYLIILCKIKKNGILKNKLQISLSFYYKI